MPSPEWYSRVQDIMNSVSEILQRTTGLLFEEFQADLTIAKAVLYDLAMIGEAIHQIPADVQSRYSQIPWSLFAQMRGVVLPDSLPARLPQVWQITHNELPILLLNLQDLLEKEESVGVEFHLKISLMDDDSLKSF